MTYGFIARGYLRYLLVCFMGYVSAREQKMNEIQILQERNEERIHAYQEMSVLREKEQLVLSVQNPVVDPVDIKEDGIATSKSDKKNHGVGLKNVQMVLEKYKGVDNMHEQDGWFYYTAIVPEGDEIG